MNRFDRRGACPGLSAPLPTGDGLLVRFMPLDGVTLADLRGICGAARRHGNGTIEVTARGSLQVRGLSAASAPLFARAIGELGIEAADGLSIVTSPLPEEAESIVDPRPIAAMVRRAVADASLALSPKVSIVIDGGGRLHLEALPADIRLRAIGCAESPLFAISMGNDSDPRTRVGAIAPVAASCVVLSLLQAIAAQGTHERASDVVHNVGVERLRSLIADHLQPAPAVSQREAAEVIGTHCLRDGSVALGIALPFGHIHSNGFAALADAAEPCGVRAVRLVPARALLLLGIAASSAGALSHEAARLGFIVDPDDPRRRIAACPGKPACASGWIAARALAAELADRLPNKAGNNRGLLSPPLWGSGVARVCGGAGNPAANQEDDQISEVMIHISGCAKGCAHPRAAVLTVVGTERGCGIVHHGSARATPMHHVDPDRLIMEIDAIGAQSREAVNA